MTFSQRMGLAPLEQAIQLSSMDEALRNDIWSALQLCLWQPYDPSDYNQYEFNLTIDELVTKIWTRLFKRAIDTVPHFKVGRASAHILLRSYVMESEWNKVYDLIEFIVEFLPGKIQTRTRNTLNIALQRENSGYRFVGNQLTKTTDQNEIKAIEDSITTGTKESKEHFSRALAMLSDRKNPDFRNSIKESISAVESVCKVISDSPSATINDALRIIKKKKEIHAAFEQALIKLFAYTSDSGGIRHGLSEGADPPTYADAKFMLVSCSAFCSYLWTQAA